MYIESLQISGGLLNGVTINFSPQLNVVIGGRGTGKTSIIELIRFCLGAGAHSEVAARSAQEQALGVLGDGEVSAVLLDAGTRIEVKRSAFDDAPRANGQFLPPLAFSQSEIEHIGLESRSRLRLIDGFGVRDSSSRKRERDGVAAKIKSLTVEIGAIAAEVREFEERSRVLPQLEEQLKALRKQQDKHAIESGNVANELAAIKERTPQLESLNLQSAALTAARIATEGWIEALGSATDFPDLDPWPTGAAVPDALVQLRAVWARVKTQIQNGRQLLLEELNALAAAHDAIRSEHNLVNNEVRALRQAVEEKQKGAGSLARQIGEISQQISALTTLTTHLEIRKERVSALLQQREIVLEKLNSLDAERYITRNKAADELNSALVPKIKADVRRAARLDAYLSTVLAALRGSGLKYNDLAARIVELVAPRELVMLAETEDAVGLSQLVDIGDERARRVISALDAAARADILVSEIEDDVALYLLDGSEYKSTEFLSTGQRCTVILPIILQHKARMILLDQPEDHLDNAFIVSTLIQAISGASAGGQRIIATHNANIPVLGEADRVFALDSDGTRCFVRTRGDLNAPEIVEAITNLMEGGKEAFQKRSDFYAAHGIR